jgi:HAD superfamily hydrolase (TIGR01509 family)
MSRFELVIFDNDGVLVDSERLANTVLAELLTEHGMACTFADSVRDFLGGTLARVHAAYQERTGRPLPDDFDNRYYERVFAGFRAGLQPMPGVIEVLDVLRAAGITCCVASSGSHGRIRLAHERAGLDGRFGGRIFSADDVAHGKPAPDLFLHAAAALGVKPARCAVIEDSPLGVAAAQAAGMTVYGFAAVTPPERLAGADAIVTAMRELPALLVDGTGA